MAEAKPREKRSARWRERLAVFAMALFPLLVSGGFFAPGFVELLALAQTTDGRARMVVVDRVGPYGHRPMLVPRDFSAGFIPELLDLDQLFLSSHYRFEPATDLMARVSSFPRLQTDSIVLDDLGQSRDIAFKDILMDQPELQLASGDDSLLPLCGTLHAGNCVRDDDLVGTTVVDEPLPIPEPGSAALLLLGLAALATLRRRA